jgi:hypothetical protein
VCTVTYILNLVILQSRNNISIDPDLWFNVQLSLNIVAGLEQHNFLFLLTIIVWSKPTVTINPINIYHCPKHPAPLYHLPPPCFSNPIPDPKILHGAKRQFLILTFHFLPLPVLTVLLEGTKQRGSYFVVLIDIDVLFVSKANETFGGAQVPRLLWLLGLGIGEICGDLTIFVWNEVNKYLCRGG